MTQVVGGRDGIRIPNRGIATPGAFCLADGGLLPARGRGSNPTPGSTQRSAPTRRTRGPGAHGAPRSGSERARSGAGPAAAEATSQPELSFSGVPGTHPVSMFGHLRHGGRAGASRNGSGPGSRKPGARAAAAI